MHPRRLRTPPPPHPVILTLPCPFPQECPPPHCRAVLLCPHVDGDLYEGAVTPNTARPVGLRPRSHPVQLGGTHEGAPGRPWGAAAPPCTRHLLAERPLLALMERPGSGRDLVMEGILTEPLNTARLS